MRALLDVRFHALQRAIPPHLCAKERVALAQALEQLEDLVTDTRVQPVLLVVFVVEPPAVDALQDLPTRQDRVLLN